MVRAIEAAGEGRLDGGLDLDAGGYSSIHGVVSSATCKVSFGAYAVFTFTAVSGRHWTNPDFPNPTDIPGLADVAFATGASGYEDVWVVQGGYGFHMLQTRQGGFPADQLVALARAMLTGLARPPR